MKLRKHPAPVGGQDPDQAVRALSAQAPGRISAWLQCSASKVSTIFQQFPAIFWLLFFSVVSVGSVLCSFVLFEFEWFSLLSVLGINVTSSLAEYGGEGPFPD